MDDDADQYFSSVPADRRALVDVLHKIIVDSFPDVAIDMQYKMPTYHFGEGWVALANQKYYVSLYTCGPHHLERFKRDHPRIKTGKGCINFKPGEEIPVADVAAVVRHAMEHPKPTPL